MHTKGPWKVDTWHYREAGRENVTVIQTDTDAIAEILPLWTPDDRKGEMDANARLIAGAPAMLTSLKFCADALEAESGTLYKAHLELARAAIAKAEGKE